MASGAGSAVGSGASAGSGASIACMNTLLRGLLAGKVGCIAQNTCLNRRPAATCVMAVKPRGCRDVVQACIISPVTQSSCLALLLKSWGRTTVPQLGLGNAQGYRCSITMQCICLTHLHVLNSSGQNLLCKSRDLVMPMLQRDDQSFSCVAGFARCYSKDGCESDRYNQVRRLRLA